MTWNWNAWDFFILLPFEKKWKTVLSLEKQFIASSLFQRHSSSSFWPPCPCLVVPAITVTSSFQKGRHPSPSLEETLSACLFPLVSTEILFVEKKVFISSQDCSSLLKWPPWVDWDYFSQDLVNVIFRSKSERAPRLVVSMVQLSAKNRFWLRSSGQFDTRPTSLVDVSESTENASTESEWQPNLVLSGVDATSVVSSPELQLRPVLSRLTPLVSLTHIGGFSTEIHNKDFSALWGKHFIHLLLFLLFHQWAPQHAMNVLIFLIWLRPHHILVFSRRDVTSSCCPLVPSFHKV